MALISEDPREPLVSVVVAAYNAGRFLPASLESVLAQSFGRYELIVVDDGSTDDTMERLRPYAGRVTVIRQRNQGPSASRNAGIRAAKGGYLAFLDADDLWNPDKLNVQVNFMERHPEIGLVFADLEEFSDEKVLSRSLLDKARFYPDIIVQLPIREAARKLLVENFIPTSSVLLRRECFDRCGLFDESLGASEDRELWLRISAGFKLGCLPVVLGKKRVHTYNLSSNVELTLRSRIRLWRGARRRFQEPQTASLIDALLADAHLHLGYVLLKKHQRIEARRHAWKGLGHALKALRCQDRRRMRIPPFRWGFALALIPLTFVRRSVSDSLGQIKNHLFYRSSSRIVA